MADTSYETWPSLDLLDLKTWQDTYTTLHMWTQIVGKVRLVQTPETHRLPQLSNQQA